MREYSKDFKRLVIYKLLSQPDSSVRRIAEQTGVAKSTVWDWKREVARVARAMTDDEFKEVKECRSSATHSPREKLRVVNLAEGLTGSELGALLRREGITEEELTAWQDSVLWALQSSKDRIADRSQIRTLEKQLRREKKLSQEKDALLELQKKVQAMWEDEEDDTASSTDD